MNRPSPTILAVLFSASVLFAPSPVWADEAARPAFVTLDGQARTHGNPVGPDTFVHHVETPVLHLMPAGAPSTKGTILLFPGGGYNILAVSHEGTATARFLNAQGFDVAILEYTVAAGRNTRDRALADALAAWRLLKTKSPALGLGHPLAGRGRFGVMGYSAGGHLAARLASYLSADQQPDDVMLIYPACLHETAPGTRVPAIRPPPAPRRLFLAIGENDNPDWVASCREYAAVWKETGSEARLEILAKAGHGFGMSEHPSDDPKRWPGPLADFLRGQGAGSGEQGAGSGERGAGSREQGVAPSSQLPAPGPWADRHRNIRADVANHKYDLIMIGDSITQNFEATECRAVWDQFFAPRRALNLGYSGARTENILWNIANGELEGQSPKVITLMIGTNNADAKNYPTHHNARQIAGGIKAIVAAIKARCPTSKILLLRCFPGAYGGPGPTSHRAALDRASELAMGLADGKQVFFCDVNHVFLNLDGSIKHELMPDWLHPNREGAKRWAQAMEPMLSELMGDASRDDALPANTAVVPVPKLEDDCYDWYARHAAVLGMKHDLDPEIVLIGDSITHFWGGEPKGGPVNGPQAYASVFAPYRVLNLGFGWDRTQNVLWRLDRGELDGLHPRTVVIHIGSNNTSQTAHARQNTPAEIVEGIAAICGRVRSKVPGVRIILVQVMPREEKRDHPRRAQIDAVNRLLKQFAGANHLDLLDLAPKLLGPDGRLPKALMPDFCHPNEAGYAIWADALRPLLGPAGL